MKTSKLIFTNKYNDGVIECIDRPWYKQMINFKYLFGITIQIKRVKDEDQ